MKLSFLYIIPALLISFFLLGGCIPNCCATIRRHNNPRRAFDCPSYLLLCRADRNVGKTLSKTIFYNLIPTFPPGKFRAHSLTSAPICWLLESLNSTRLLLPIHSRGKPHQSRKSTYSMSVWKNSDSSSQTNPKYLVTRFV